MRQISIALLFCGAVPAFLFAQPAGGDGYWVRNAVAVEITTFDQCNAHQPPSSGDYHYHANPVCTRYQVGDNIVKTNGRFREADAPWKHSPILGWAYDGYPIYGPYGYSDPKSSGSAVKRIQPSFRLRNITQRHTYADWSYSLHGLTALTTDQYGPDVSTKFPLGWYVEDFEFIDGLGDLDVYNGRFTVTPEYPNGTYAYFITVNDDGSPAFPYALGRQYYGSYSGTSRVTSVTETTTDYFNNFALTSNISTDPLLNSWDTRYAGQYAQIIDGQNLAAGAVTTWSGQTTAAHAGVQRIRYSDNYLYINSTGLAPHTMGPWYNLQAADGIFENYPKDQSAQERYPRKPAAATTKYTSSGPLGRLVDGIPMNNMLDGASWTKSVNGDSQSTTSTGTGTGGPPAGGGTGGGTGTMTIAGLDITNGAFIPASAATAHLSALTAGSISTLWVSNLGLTATSATTTETAWSDTLAGISVTVKDASGTTRSAKLQYASPTQINYLVPSGTSTGTATITATGNGVTKTSTATITDVAPRFFLADSTTNLAAANIVTLNGNALTYQTVSASPVDLSTGQVYLILYGTGLRSVSSLTNVTATIGGTAATVYYAGAQSQTPGLDQLNLLIPSSLAGAGSVDIVVFADKRRSNVVTINLK